MKRFQQIHQHHLDKNLKKEIIGIHLYLLMLITIKEIKNIKQVKDIEVFIL
jgi:hypothetical protein